MPSGQATLGSPILPVASRHLCGSVKIELTGGADTSMSARCSGVATTAR